MKKNSKTCSVIHVHTLGIHIENYKSQHRLSSFVTLFINTINTFEKEVNSKCKSFMRNLGVNCRGFLDMLKSKIFFVEFMNQK